MWMPHTLLSKMVQLARKPEMSDLKPKPRYRPLAKLKTLIPYETAGYDSRAGLQQVEPLLALPNLENMYSVSGMACFDGYTGIPFRWQTWHLRYNLAGGIALRRLEIAYGCCDAEGITAMLGNTPKLEVFKYSHQTKWHGCEHEWEAGLFVSALARCVGKTLKQLALRAERGCIPCGKPIFTNFDRLEELEVDVRILFKHENGDGAMLQHRLPGNINKVLLNLERGGAASELYVDWVSCIYGFGGVWKGRFSVLESVVVRAKTPDENEGANAYEHWDVFEDFESAGRLCETAGIGWKPLSEQRFNLMGWKRQFCERFDVT